MKVLFLLALILHAQLATAQTVSSPLDPKIALSKSAFSLPMDFVQGFQRSYNRTTIDRIGRENLLTSNELIEIENAVVKEHPQVAKMNTKLLDEFLLRTDLTLRLAKNGFMAAAKQEFTYDVGAIGELSAAITVVIGDTKKSDAVIQNVILTAMRQSIDRYGFLRRAERERLRIQAKAMTQALRDPEFRKSAGADQRATLRDSAFWRGLAWAVATIVVLVGGYIGLSYIQVSQHIDFMQMDAIENAGALIDIGVLVSSISYYATKYIKLLQPWRKKPMIPTVAACDAFLSDMPEGGSP